MSLLRPDSSNGASAAGVASLGEGIVAGVFDLPTGASLDECSLLLRGEHESIPLDARLRELPDHASVPGAAFAAHIPEPGSADVATLMLRTSAGELPLGPSPLSAGLAEAGYLAQTRLSRLPTGDRLAIVRFFGEARADLIDAAFGAEATPGRDGSLALLELRDAVREPLPPSQIGPESAQIVALDQIFIVDEHSIWLSGWVFDPDPEQAVVTVLAPDGATGRVAWEHMTMYARPDVDEAIGRDADSGGPASLGFKGVVEVETPARDAGGWTLQITSAAGPGAETTRDQPAVDDPNRLRGLAMRPLRQERFDDEVVEEQVFPVIDRLLHRMGGGIEAGEELEFGDVPRRPEVSVVVLIRGRLDVLEHQIVSFAGDPGIRAAEILLVVAPGAAEKATDVADQLHRLYGLPFRMLALEKGGSAAGMKNFGAANARGRLLVFLAGDVFPAAQGWLDAMRERHDGGSGLGAVGAKLLHRDGAIRHSGYSFRAVGDSGRWERFAPLEGLHGSVPGASVAAPVRSVDGACLMISAAAFREQGGFAGIYFDEEHEDDDLCLRIGESGLECWFEPGAELHHLAGEVWKARIGLPAERYNAWLFSRRWGERLAQLPEDEGPSFTRLDEAPVAPPWGLPDGSGRPGRTVEMLEVNVAEEDARLVAGLELPAVDDDPPAYADTYAIALKGFAAPRDGSRATVVVSSEGRELRRFEPQEARPDVGEAHPELSNVENAGFAELIGTLEMPPKFGLSVNVEFETGETTSLAKINGRRRVLRSGFEPSLQPLLLTTLGRTGSSWVNLLLAQHPSVVGYKPFAFEARVSSYWTAALTALAQPASYMQSIRPELYGGHWWIGDERTSPLPLDLTDTEMAVWLGRENVETLAGFCQSRMEAFYRRVAESEGKRDARYFTEKCWPDQVTPRLLAELYPDGREILLVRDFRDMVCSIFGFNALRGFASFGRESAESDTEFIRELRDSALRMAESWEERSDRAFLLRYEDVIQKPEETLAEVFRYLEVEDDPETVAEVRRAANDTRPVAQRKHRTSGSAADSVARWQRELSPELIAVCEESFGDLLERFGYETNGAEPDPETTASATEAA